MLCEISSDLSAADEKRFIEKNKSFWSMKKHYLLIEYSVRVLIGPADIRFELWFNDQKLSRDQSITVEWTPSKAPVSGMTPSKDPESYLPAYGRAELPDAPPGHNGSPKAELDGTAVVEKDGVSDGEDRKRRSMGGLMARARGGRWSGKN
jgi:hypothetical protein